MTLFYQNSYEPKMARRKAKIATTYREKKSSSHNRNTESKRKVRF